MPEGSVPIDHKKDDQSKCEVHQKEHDAAGTVLYNEYRSSKKGYLP